MGGLWFAIIFGVVMTIILYIKNPDMVTRPRYTNGHEYENYVAWWLRNHGYSSVKVTAKSGDYGADIICVDSSGRRVAVQCKMYKESVGYKAVEEALSGMHYYGCDRAMVVTTGTFTKQATDAARRCGVELKAGVV